MNNRKLAMLAGVSPATVSKVFSGSPEISEETASRVRKLAAEYGWVPPKYRTSPMTPTRVAIIVPEIISVFYASIVSAAVESFRACGMEPDIRITGFDDTTIKNTIAILQEERDIAGILTIDITAALASELSSKRQPLEPPIVNLTYTNNKDSSVSCVYTNAEEATELAIQHLLSLGHTRIAYIGERNSIVQLQTFKTSMQRHQLTYREEDLFISDKRFEEIGYDAISAFIQMQKASASFLFPTALYCAYDEVAMGAIHALTEAGIRVPEDISVIGTNDIAAASYTTVPLTTIHVFIEEAMLLAVRMLCQHISDLKEHRIHDTVPPNFTQRVEVHPELVIRESTAPPRKEEQLHPQNLPKKFGALQELHKKEAIEK